MGARVHPILENHAYFLTCVVAKRTPVFASEDAAGLFIDCLTAARRELDLALLSFVVMPDHVHLLLVPAPDTTMAQIMQLVKGRFARRWNQAVRARGSVWQPRYWEPMARTEEQLLAWVDYVDQNPVKAGLAESPTEYRFGSASLPSLSDLERYLDGTWGDQWLNQGPGQAGSLAFVSSESHGSTPDA